MAFEDDHAFPARVHAVFRPTPKTARPAFNLADKSPIPLDPSHQLRPPNRVTNRHDRLQNLRKALEVEHVGAIAQGLVGVVVDFHEEGVDAGGDAGQMLGLCGFSGARF